MSRPPSKAEPAQLVALVPKNKREAVTVSVVGSAEDRRIELREVATFPGEKLVTGSHSFRLRPNMLQGIADAFLSIADATDARAVELPSPEELAEDIKAAPEHFKAITGVIGMGRGAFLVACPGDLPFRVFVNGPSILLVNDAAARGPGGFDVNCLLAALKRAGMVVVTIEHPVPNHYHAAAGKILEGTSSVIIETREAQARNWLAFLAVETPDAPVLMRKSEPVVEPTGSLH